MDRYWNEKNLFIQSNKSKRDSRTIDVEDKRMKRGFKAKEAILQDWSEKKWNIIISTSWKFQFQPLPFSLSVNDGAECASPIGELWAPIWRSIRLPQVVTLSLSSPADIGADYGGGGCEAAVPHKLFCERLNPPQNNTKTWKFCYSIPEVVVVGSNR